MDALSSISCSIWTVTREKSAALPQVFAYLYIGDSVFVFMNSQVGLGHCDGENEGMQRRKRKLKTLRSERDSYGHRREASLGCGWEDHIAWRQTSLYILISCPGRSALTHLNTPTPSPGLQLQSKHSAFRWNLPQVELTVKQVPYFVQVDLKIGNLVKEKSKLK